MLICMACSSQALFPGNEVAEIYHEMARKVTLFYNVYFVLDVLSCLAEVCAMLDFSCECFMLFTKLDTKMWSSTFPK